LPIEDKDGNLIVSCQEQDDAGLRFLVEREMVVVDGSSTPLAAAVPDSGFDYVDNNQQIGYT
jgi:hypothetical protein